MSRLKCGDQNWSACSRCGRTRDLDNERISSFFLYLKLRAMNPSTLLAVLQLFSICFCHLWSLVWLFRDPAVDLLLATIDWTCFSCFACCCVRCASQNIYLHWNSFATCQPTQLVYWYLPVVPFVIRVSRTVAKFGIICKFRHFAGNINVKIIYIYIRNSSSLIHYLVVHQMWLVQSY